MYRIGFGDCFLVTLAGTHHILVDCGVHNRGNITVNGDSLIHKAFENIQQVTGNKLDILIATHAHQDHVSGYGTFADAFRQFDIGEVWMPWTEDPNDATAQKWRAKKMALVQVLQRALTAAADAKAAAAVDNAVANPAAMNALHSGFGKVKPRYLKAGDKLEAPGGIAGFSVSILGPPQDQTFLSKMNPPGSDHFLRMAVAAMQGINLQPFADWALAESDLPPEWPRLDEQIVSEFSARTAMPAAAMAFSLDKLLNNTSIVALFSWDGKQMLFPGDAQYGDWAYWYKKTGADVLSDICFYKVAHHGSMNATPKGALEDMPQGKFAAMASTQSKPWPSIPQKALIDAIGARTDGAVVRSDSIAVGGAPAGPALGKLPSGFQLGQTSQGEYWIDYQIA
jgi:beta-lactamase superfamily II metal-dependent hydrolase